MLTGHVATSDHAVLGPVVLGHPARRGTGEFMRMSCGELAKPFGDRVDGQLVGGDVDHEVVDVVVAGA